jgi:AcrR family transcriptional regulator
VPKIADSDRYERRQRLVDAAWRCASRQGYRDMTVDDVCAEAHASKGAFYGYFGSKLDLLLALLDDDTSQIDQEMDRLEAQGLSPGERIRRFTKWMLQRGESPGHAQLRADLWASVLTEAHVRERLSASVGRRRRRLRGWIEAGTADGELAEVPANAFASALLALADGVLLHSALDPSAFRWPRIRHALDLLLEGVRRR